MILTTAVKQPKHLLDWFYTQIRPDKGRPGHAYMGLLAKWFGLRIIHYAKLLQIENRELE
jgi:hypothetical protein